MYSAKDIVTHLAGGIIKTLRKRYPTMNERDLVAMAFRIAWRMAKDYGMVDERLQITDKGIQILKRKEERLRGNS